MGAARAMTAARKAAPPKSPLAAKLRRLSKRMASVAYDMEYYGGFSERMRLHAFELYGAAKITGEWADEIAAGKA